MDEWTNEQTDEPTFSAACWSYEGDGKNITRIASSIVSCFYFALTLFFVCFNSYLLLLCTYTSENSKIKQRRHWSLHELFLDGTEIDFINDSIKSLELHIGSFISSTEEEMNKKMLTPQLEKVKVFTFTQTLLSGKTV